MRTFLTAAILIGVISPIYPVCAQEKPEGETADNAILLGVGLVNEYENADFIRVMPFVFGSFKIGDITINARGQGMRSELPAKSRLSMGSVISTLFPRDDGDGFIAFLPETGRAIESGGFTAYRFGGDTPGQGSLQSELRMVQDFSEPRNGFVATVSTTYAAVRTQNLLVSIDTQKISGELRLRAYQFRI